MFELGELYNSSLISVILNPWKFCVSKDRTFFSKFNVLHNLVILTINYFVYLRSTTCARMLVFQLPTFAPNCYAY